MSSKILFWSGDPLKKPGKHVRLIYWRIGQKMVWILMMDMNGVRQSSSNDTVPSRSWRIVSAPLCTILFVFVGILHFAKTPAFLRIMPPQIPFPLELVYISGVVEILAGLGLLWKSTKPASVMILVMLLVAVFPANVHMAMNPGQFPEIPIWVLYVRLPFQAVLALWVWSCRD